MKKVRTAVWLLVLTLGVTLPNLARGDVEDGRDSSPAQTAISSQSDANDKGRAEVGDAAISSKDEISQVGSEDLERRVAAEFERLKQEQSHKLEALDEGGQIAVQKVMEDFQKSVPLAERNGRRAVIAELERCRKAFQATVGPDSVIELYILMMLTETCENARDFEAALGYAQQTLVIQRRVMSPVAQVMTLWKISVVQQKMKQLQQAIETAEKAMELMDQMQMTGGRSRAMLEIHLSQLHVGLKESEKAIVLTHSAENSIQSVSNPVEKGLAIGSILSFRAEALLQLGRIAEAVKSLENSNAQLRNLPAVSQTPAVKALIVKNNDALLQQLKDQAAPEAQEKAGHLQAERDRLQSELDAVANP